MKHTNRTRAGIAVVLALLVLGCTPVAGVDDNYYYGAPNANYGVDNFTGPFRYTSQPAYVNGGFGTYSLGAPIYSSSSLEVVPEWVTAPNNRSSNYAGNAAYRAGETGMGIDPFLP